MENGFDKISKAFAPLEEQELLKYLPDFECCGSCAWYSIRNEDWEPFKYVATFNEQTKESAIDQGELRLSVSSFSVDYSKEPVDLSTVHESMDAVKSALLNAGFELLDSKGPVNYHQDFKYNTFYETNGGFVVWDRFE